MRDVLVVLFWLWLAVSLGVYGYRLWRRTTRGPRARRDAGVEPADAGRGDGRGAGRSPTRAAPPLPEGPVEARLPRSLQGLAAPARPDAPEPAAPDRVVPAAAAEAPPPRPTVAAALEGIRLPDGLVPVVDPDDHDLADGTRARFAAAGRAVPEVAVGLADELERLGYAVDGLGGASPERAALRAARGTTTVAVAVHLDRDAGTTLVELTV